MAILIDDNTFNEIRAVLNDVQDTFYQREVTYRRDMDSVTEWQEETDAERKYEDLLLNALIVWNTSKENAQALREYIGAFDGNISYANVKYDDALSIGLIDGSKTVVYKPIEDKIVVDGINYPVLGIVKLGQLKDTEVVVKILFTKDVVNKTA